MKLNRHFASLFVLLSCLPLLGAESNAPPANLLSLDVVLREIFASNPSLKSARANAEAMAARIPQARAWDDPRMGVDVERSGSTRFFDWTDTEWMISQSIPLNGKNRSRARAASAEAEGARADLRQREIELAVRARASFARLANAYAQLEISRDVESLLRRVIEIIQSKFSTGMAMQSDALMMESDLVKLIEARRDLERRISDEQSQINVLMNRPPQSPLSSPARNVFVDLKFNLDELQQRALVARPDLQSVQARIKAAGARVELAKRAWVPDPEIRLEARQFHGASGFINEYDTGIFFSFPWLNRGKYRSAIVEAELGREAAELELEAARAQVLGAVRDQLQKIETLRQHYTLFRDRLEPLAREAAEAARVAYLNGKAQSLDVITALRTVREVSAALQDYLQDYLVAVAELEGVIGAPLGEMKPSAKAN